jgi:hypothetical protein
MLAEVEEAGKNMTNMIARIFLSALLFCGVASAETAKSDAPCAPGISFWSLLQYASVGYSDGHLQIEKLYAVCLPATKPAGDSNYAYSPEQGGKLTSVIKGAEGQLINTYVWYAENISGLWELSNYKVLGGTVSSLKPGRYTLEFQIDGNMFYRFPFSVSSVDSTDPYSPPGTRYFIDGAWSDYGNIFYQRNDPASTLRFTTWLQEKVSRVEKKSTPYTAELVRMQDGKVIGQDRGDLNLAPQWQQMDVYFQPGNGGAKGTPIKASELLQQDGAYQVHLTVDGKPYGTYALSVKEGKIQLQGRQLPEHSPTTDRIVDTMSGGRYLSWWIKRDGGAKLSSP